MSSDAPQVDPNKDEIKPVKPKSQRVAPAKRIEAESQSRNSYERLFIVRLLAFGLIVALTVDVGAYFAVNFWSPADPARPYTDHVKDILLVISSIAAYLLGYGSSEKKEDN